MRKLRYVINVTLDGCVDHGAGSPDAELHQFHADLIAEADAPLYGRVTYQLMEFWRPIARGEVPEGMPDWMLPFAHVIDKAKKYVVSDSLQSADWNSDLVRGAELVETVRALKAQPGRLLLTGGVALPLALAEMGLIDEYEFVVMPRLAGHGPTLMAGLSKMVDLTLAERREFASGAMALRYEARG